MLYNIILDNEHDLIVHHCEKFELEEHKDANDISNPHYTEVRIATDHSHLPPLHDNIIANNLPNKSERGDSMSSKNEHGSSLTTQQHPYSEAEEIANNSHSDQIKNQESHRIHTETIDVSSEYAVVDKSKKTSRLQSSGIAVTKAEENPKYDKLKPDRPAKDVVTSKEGKNQMDNLLERSPSPEYAELSTREKIPKVTKSPTEKALQEKDYCKSDSHEYDKLASISQASAKVTKEEAEEVQQHYYHILEYPEEIGSKEETTIIINAGEIENSMPPAHDLVTDDKPIVSNTAAKADVKETNASSLHLHQGEASDDKA